LSSPFNKHNNQTEQGTILLQKLSEFAQEAQLSLRDHASAAHYTAG